LKAAGYTAAAVIGKIVPAGTSAVMTVD